MTAQTPQGEVVRMPATPDATTEAPAATPRPAVLPVADIEVPELHSRNPFLGTAVAADIAESPWKS